MAVATQTPRRTRGGALDGFDRFVERVLRDWKVNGAAVIIVRDGEVAFSRGYGLRDAGKGLPVTEHTLFPLASVTKAFTTMAIGILADDGILDWDTPVRHYLPAFALWDQFATERMTPRDLVTHRSGLPRHDLMWYHSTASRAELVERLRYLEPTKDFRTMFQYQNLMYMTAGYLAGEVVGSTWEEVVESRIFEPLGMVSSNFSVVTSQQAPDFSLPYRRKKNRIEEIPFYVEQDALGPAGSIVSSAADMGQWLKLHLGRGQVGDLRIVSEGQVRQMHSPQIVIPSAGRWPEMPANSYGLGWDVQPYRGRALVHHGGNIDGFSTLCAFLPDDNLGVVVLSNSDASPSPYIIAWNVFDRCIGGPVVPWSRRFKEDRKEFEAAEQRGKEKRAEDRIRGTRPSHPLGAYTGTYAHSGYGRLRVDLVDGKLVAAYNGMDLPMKHYHYDTFELTYERFDFTAKVTFAANHRGEIAQISAPLEPTVRDIIFERVPDETMTDPAFLETFCGTYEFMGLPVVVSFKNDALQVAVPGQPEYVLTPVKGTEFAVRGLSGFSVTFNVDAEGRASEALLNQMGAVFTAKRRSD
jgi:CubicO group peptidase (beta-lactamase class C family)